MGGRSPQLEQLLRRVTSVPGTPAEVGPPAGTGPDGTMPLASVSGTSSSPSGLRLPPRPVSALLVLIFLAFGVLLGHTAGTPVSDTLASTRAPLKVVLPAATPTSAAAAPSEPSSSSAEPPSSEPEQTPTPASTTTSTATSHPSATKGSAGAERESGNTQSESTNAAAPAKKLPPIKHVFVIMLSDEPYAAVFGPSSTAPYITGTLEKQGELLVRYDAVAHDGLADEVALLSGQGPTTETAANCPTYSEITPTGVGADEQVLGGGCVYPRSTQTLLSQLVAKHLTWRAYIEGIDEAGTPDGACAHPALGQPDATGEETTSSGPYATFRNPFVYFASILDGPECAANDVGLSSLAPDLAAPKRTPSFSYIVPNRCHDGNPTPCTAGAPAGVGQANSFLAQVVGEITASKAYKESGLLVITVDEAPASGELADSSSCCGQPLFPNDPSKTLTGAPRGGGSVGALLLSPYVKGATTSQEPFNHFSLLRTIEDLFGLRHLGYAGLSTVNSLEPAMFTAGKLTGKG